MKRLLCISAVLLLLLTMTSGAMAAEALGQNESLLTATNEPGTRAQEMPLGNVAADAVRYCAGADIALIPGGCFRFNLLGGDVTREDLELVFPEKDPLGTAEMTPAQVWDTLEHSFSTFVIGEGDRVDWEKSAWDGFLQVSGLRARVDVTNEPGERVLEIVLDDGRSLSPKDETTLLTVAATTAMLEGGYGYEAVLWNDLALTLPQAMEKYMAAQGGVLRAAVSGRIDQIGTPDGALLSGIRSSAVLFLVCAGVIALTGAATFGKSIAWKAMKDRAMPETEEEKNSELNRFLK